MKLTFWKSVAAIILLIVAFSFAYTAGPTVSAQGVASLDATPDRVSVTLVVETKNSSSSSAQQENVRISDALTIALQKKSISDDSLQFSNFNVYPISDWDNGKQIDRGFSARRELIVKTSNFKEVSSIVDAAIEAGALVSYINLELSSERENAYKAQTLALASSDARTKAGAIASGQGKRLGRLVSLTNSEFNYGGPIMYYTAAAEKNAVGTADVQRAAVEIAPRDMKVSATVNAAYKLGWF